MIYFKIALAVIISITGLRAAYFSRRASLVQISPSDGIYSGDYQMQQMAWTVANMKSDAKSSELNKNAAYWTYVTVILAFTSALFSN